MHNYMIQFAATMYFVVFSLLLAYHGGNVTLALVLLALFLAGLSQFVVQDTRYKVARIGDTIVHIAMLAGALAFVAWLLGF